MKATDKKAIWHMTFSLDNKILKQYYKHDFKKPYAQIKNFMLKNNFVSKVDSDYQSNKMIDHWKIKDLLNDIKKTK